ncbi:MAG: AbrB/MazE/SpoVT family DNA-binding domain-containing protein [Eggerthellaceae bacterium]|nr:AbrB/MazE/SpoVT family DNA-binding domain-containing protein [Eggerthellaceae bacterium]
MIATIRKRSQITLPREIVTKLGLSEGDQLDVLEQDGTIMLFPMTTYPTKYITNLKKEVDDIKAKIASGKQPVFDTVDALFESLDNQYDV